MISISFTKRRWCMPLLLVSLLLVACKESKPTTTHPANARQKTDHVASALPSQPNGSQKPASEASVITWNFEGMTAGKAPTNWLTPTGQWRVEAAQTPGQSMLLVQTAANASPIFNLALAQGSSFMDVDLSLRLRAIKGQIDQGGGVVWRAKGADDYYLARYNPLEDNYRAYTVKDGKRKQLASAIVKADPTAWHTLRVTMKGDHIECFMNGQKHLDLRDATFADPGMIGLWTKADAQTQFDELAAR